MPSGGYLWNTAEWIRRLGFNRQDQPEINYSVQPVQLVSDASALTTPLLPAQAWAGGLSNGAAGQFGGFAIRSRAPGGSFVKSLRASVGVQTNAFVWVTGEPLHSFNSGERTVPLFQFGPIPCTAEVRIGRTTAGLVQNESPTCTQDADMSIFRDEIYIPPNEEFYIEFNAVGFNSNYAALIQDVPVLIPSAEV